jgi:hypothetical protein
LTTNALGGILWFGPASALATVFTPFIVGLDDVPTSFRSGHHAVFSRASAFWAVCVVHNVANLKWNYAIQDITKLQDKLELASVQMVSQQEELYRKNKNMIAVQEAYYQNIERIVAALWSLSDRILFKYASGFVNEPTMSQMVGYPKWWLEAVDYEQGPPPPPTKPKCCHPHKDGGNEVMKSLSASGDFDMFLTGKAAMKQYLRTKQILGDDAPSVRL